MVYKIFFCSEYVDNLDKAGRKMRRRRKIHTNKKCYAFCAKPIVYCYVLFNETANIDEAVQQQPIL